MCVLLYQPEDVAIPAADDTARTRALGLQSA
jgi:hypothetical protein